MKVSPIPGLLFISIIFLWSGCSIRNYHLSELTETERPNQVKLRPLFADTFSTALFKAQVDIYGRYFGGLIFLKKTGPNSYRTIMTTETGLQIFDLELIADSMVVHSCIDKMNKMAVLKTIELDIRLLLMNGLNDKIPSLLKDNAGEHTVFKFREGKKLTYYYIENKTGYLDKIEQASPWYKEVSVQLKYQLNNSIESIVFIHHNARLQIKLRLLKIS